ARRRVPGHAGRARRSTGEGCGGGGLMAVTETALGELGIVLGGEQVETGETYEVRSPYDDAPVAVVHRAGPHEVERAIAGAVEAFATTRRLPSWQREQVLERVSAGIAERIDGSEERQVTLRLGGKDVVYT